MVQYLRPQTLFGSKFESYLNQPWTNGLPADPTKLAIQQWAEKKEAENNVVATYAEGGDIVDYGAIPDDYHGYL
jgi:hypothetical protein